MSDNETFGADAGEADLTASSRFRELMADRRALALVGVAGLAVILLIAFVLVPALTGSSSSSGPVAKGTPPSRATASATPTPSASAAPVVPAAAQLAVRDPFDPLLKAAGSGGGAAGGTSSSASATASPSSTVVVQPADLSGLRQLTLVAIDGPGTAQVTVNGLAYNVVLNTQFGGGFAMIGETDSSATFTYNGSVQTLVPGQYAFFN